MKIEYLLCFQCLCKLTFAGVEVATLQKVVIHVYIFFAQACVLCLYYIVMYVCLPLNSSERHKYSLLNHKHVMQTSRRKASTKQNA